MGLQVSCSLLGMPDDFPWTTFPSPEAVTAFLQVLVLMRALALRSRFR